MASTSKYGVMQNVGWMLGNAWRERKSVLALCLLSAAVALGVDLTRLFLAPVILEKVEQGVPLPRLLLTIGGFTLALFLLMGLKAYLAENTMCGRVAVRMDITGRLVEKTNATSFPNTLDPGALAMGERARDGVENNAGPGEHIWTTLTDLLTALAGFGVYLALLSNLDGRLLAVTAATSAAGFLITTRTGSWRYRHREEEAAFDQRLRYVREKAESPVLAKDIRLFGLQEWLTDVYRSALALCEGFIRRAEGVALLGDTADVVFSVGRNGIAYYYLISMALREGLAASEFLLYFTAVSGFTAWITAILRQASALRKESLELSVIREYLELEEPFRFGGGAPIPPAEGYELRLEGGSYRYPGAEKDTVSHLDLTVRAGEKLAIVGLNGAGKTTLVKLLCGLLDPTEGRVLLNGQDIRDFDRRAYYGLFSAVFQDFSLLDVTVAETVAQRREGIDRRRVEECLEKAGLTAMVCALPQGLDTHVGRAVYEDGVLFPGGQTQRLMLARALYKDGPILLLDEPTAALDPIAENDIYLKYSGMTRGKTSLFISHRLASTRFCDRILYMEGGAVAEEGTHEELLARGGAYAALFEVQSRYYREGREF